jgi:hypothetical protein
MKRRRSRIPWKWDTYSNVTTRVVRLIACGGLARRFRCDTLKREMASSAASVKGTLLLASLKYLRSKGQEDVERVLQRLSAEDLAVLNGTLLPRSVASTRRPARGTARSPPAAPLMVSLWWGNSECHEAPPASGRSPANARVSRYVPFQTARPDLADAVVGLGPGTLAEADTLVDLAWVRAKRLVRARWRGSPRQLELLGAASRPSRGRRSR